MNVKSFVLDIGIPALVVLATGLGTYMLTGGPEEFPSPEGPVEMEDSETVEDVEYEDDGGIGGRDVRNTRTDQTAVPAWANGVRREFFVMNIFFTLFYTFTLIVQLAEQTKSLSEEIRLLKEATQANMQLQQEQIRAVMMQRAVCGQCRALLEEERPASSIKAPQPVKRWTLQDWQAQLRCSFWKLAFSDHTVTDEALLTQAVNKFQNRTHESAAEPSAPATDSAERPDPILAPACELLLMYLTNLIKNPAIPRYRRISTVNAAYAKSLAVLPAHEDILRAIGFSRKADSTVFEYEWYNLPAVDIAEAAENAKEMRSNGASAATQRPATAAEAKALLDEAVVLLTALKAGRAAFVEKLASCLAAGDETSSGGGSLNETTSGEKGPAVMEAPVSGAKAFVTAGAGANSSTAVASGTMSAQESLITVCDLLLNEETQQTAQPTADSLDFMQVK
jgi:hypothetical protein